MTKTTREMKTVMNTAALTGLGFVGISCIWKNALEEIIIVDVTGLAVGGKALVWVGLTLKAYTMAKHLRDTSPSYYVCEENDSDSDSDSESQNECSCKACSNFS